MWGKKKKKVRDDLREVMHDLRKQPRLAVIETVCSTCTKWGIPLEEVGTASWEIRNLESEAHRRLAKMALEKMRKGEGDPRTALAEVTKHLWGTHVGTWASIGTTWQELRDLHHQNLLKAAKDLYHGAGGDAEVRTQISSHDAERIEYMLLLAGADISELDTSLDDATWEELKKA